jgi:hypothetical protein
VTKKRATSSLERPEVEDVSERGWL